MRDVVDVVNPAGFNTFRIQSNYTSMNDPFTLLSSSLSLLSAIRPYSISFFQADSHPSISQLTSSTCLCEWMCVCHTPWMLSICPSFNAAPLTLHRVLTMRSALASFRKGLESRMPFLLSPAEAQNRERVLLVLWLLVFNVLTLKSNFRVKF